MKSKCRFRVRIGLVSIFFFFLWHRGYYKLILESQICGVTNIDVEWAN